MGIGSALYVSYRSVLSFVAEHKPLVEVTVGIAAVVIGVLTYSINEKVGDMSRQAAERERTIAIVSPIMLDPDFRAVQKLARKAAERTYFETQALRKELITQRQRLKSDQISDKEIKVLQEQISQLKSETKLKNASIVRELIYEHDEEQRRNFGSGFSTPLFRDKLMTVLAHANTAGRCVKDSNGLCDLRTALSLFGQPIFDLFINIRAALYCDPYIFPAGGSDADAEAALPDNLQDLRLFVEEWAKAQKYPDEAITDIFRRTDGSCDTFSSATQAYRFPSHGRAEAARTSPRLERSGGKRLLEERAHSGPPL